MEVLFEYQRIWTILNCKQSKIAENIENNLAELAALPQTSASESALEVHMLQSFRTVRRKSKLGRTKYLLQHFMKEWNTFINVDSMEQIKNWDTSTVVPTGGLPSSINSQAELAQPKVAS